MATTPKRSPTPERTAAEDPDTAAARKELRQTAISEKPDLSAMAANDHASPSDDAPGAAKDLMLSPKKKRAHDEVDEPKDTAADADTDGDVSPIGANGSASLSRTDRSEPEKKRPRDISSELKAAPTISAAKPLLNFKDATTKASFAQASSPKSGGSDSDKGQPTGTKSNQTPAKNSTTSAFQTSTLSAFANQQSPFLQASTGQTPLSTFAGPLSAHSSFSMTTPAAHSIFSAGGSSGTSSPFGQLGPAPSPFGGLGGSLGGTPFGAPGRSLTSNKPAKPFGAPASDNDDETDNDDDSNADGDDGDDAGNQGDGDDGADGADGAGATGDGGRPRPQPVAANDDEASIIQARGKLYSLDKTTNSWKERGAGILKLMVPKECAVSGDNPNAGLPGSFDPTALKDSESKIIRLVMRQDATHRIILNTTLLPNMEFREKSGLRATSVLFTAIEDDGPVSITLRMNAAHAKRFVNDIESPLPNIYVNDEVEAQRPEFAQNPSTAPPAPQVSEDGNGAGRHGSASHVPKIPGARHSTPPSVESGTSFSSSSPKRDRRELETKGPITRARLARATKY
ncbi:hypothetical protein F5B21DRAFT_526157 [Xylaria acuta]|nr:hypothetical protein F5B21DRAFT_526157 [Xylaria acuta]